jgi:hypothetical protein
MREVVGDFSGKKIGATHFQRSEPIDAVWVTVDIEVENACIMPLGYSVGDHMLFVVDFRTSSIVGTDPTKLVRLALCRLNTKIAWCVNKFNHHLQCNILCRQSLEHLPATAMAGKDRVVVELRLNKLDEEGKQYMKHAEQRCQHLKSGRIPFSPEAALLIRRCKVYCSLLRWHAGRAQN